MSPPGTQPETPPHSEAPGRPCRGGGGEPGVTYSSQGCSRHYACYGHRMALTLSSDLTAQRGHHGDSRLQL